MEHLQQQPDILEVQSGRRLIQDVQRATRVPFGELSRELHALGLAAREGRRRLSEVDVSETYVVEQLEFRPDTRLVLEEIERVGHRQIEHVGDRLSFVPDLQGFPIVTPALTDFARNVDVGEEVHLDFDEPVALTRFAAAPLDVEGKPPGPVPAQLGLREIREQLPDRGEEAGIRGRIRARGATNRALIDVDDFVDLIETLQAIVGARNDLRTVEMARE